MQNLTVDFSELLVSHRHRNSARKLGALFAIGLFLLSAAHRAQAAEPVKIPMTARPMEHDGRHGQLRRVFGKAFHRIEGWQLRATH